MNTNLQHTASHRLPLRGFGSGPRAAGGFTLVELLVVISIIAILAAMIIPAVGRAKIRTKEAQAKIEIGQIITAIKAYEAAYNRFPVSTNAMNAAAAAGADFTYGGILTNALGAGFTPPALSQVGYQPANYNYNAEVMAILMDWTNYPNGQVAVVNANHVKNPQHTAFLNARVSDVPNGPGLGPDGVYRDPFGNPYIITFDLNYDEKARDAVYREQNISAVPNDPNRGLNGLIRVMAGGQPYFESSSAVMVWSAGYDKKVEPGLPANQGVNKDNILGWKQ